MTKKKRIACYIACSLALLIASAGLISACKMRRATLRNSIAEREALAFIIPGSLKFHRSAEDQKIGILQFETKFEALYELQYWVKGSNDNNPQTFPCAQPPADKPCSGVVAQTAFNLKITLDAQSRYTFRLFIWPTNMPKQSAKTLMIDESELTQDTNRIVTNLVIAKTIMPLQTTEVYRERLAQATPLSAIQAKLTTEPGCSNKPLVMEYPFNDADEDVKLKSLQSNGFGVATAHLHDYFKNRFVMEFENLERQLVWEIGFNWAGKDYSFKSRPAAYMNRVLLVTADGETRLRNKELISALSPLALKTNSAVKVRWEPANITAFSYVAVNLKGKQSGYEITCIFPGDGEQDQLGAQELPEGTIDAALLQKAPADDYGMLVYFDSSQIQVRDEEGFPTWVLTSQDWRFERVVKQ